MSRTDAHRPPRVHLAEAAQAYHDHSDGPCDLPDIDDVVSGRVNRRRVRTRCSWWLPTNYQYEHSPYSAYPQCFTYRDPKHARRGKRNDIAERLTDLDTDLNLDD